MKASGVGATGAWCDVFQQLMAIGFTVGYPQFSAEVVVDALLIGSVGAVTG